MPDVEKFMTVDAGDIEKIMGVSKDDIEEVMGLSLAFVDPYSGTRLISQGTGARYSIWGGGYVQSGANWTGMDAEGYADTIAQKNPFNGTDATHTGDMDWGKSSCGVSSNGTIQISSGGFNSPASAAGHASWDAPAGPYIAGTIESLNSSTGGDAGTWGTVHYYDEKGDSAPADDDEMWYGMNAVGEDGSTGYYAGGSSRTSGFTNTNEIWKISLSSASDSLDWGSNLSSNQTGGMNSLSGITTGGADTRWIMFGGGMGAGTKYFTFASSGSGDAHGDLLALHNYANDAENTNHALHAAGSNGTTGLIMGGSNQVDSGPEWIAQHGNTIQYLTIASTGNAAMWGDTSLISAGYNGRACNGQYLEAYTAVLYQDRPNDDTQAATPRTGASDRVSLVSAGNASANGNHLGIVYGEMDTCLNGGTGSN